MINNNDFSELERERISEEKERITKQILLVTITELSNSKLSSKDLPEGLSEHSLIHFSKEKRVCEMIKMSALGNDENSILNYFHENASMISKEKNYAYQALYNQIKQLLHDKGVHPLNREHDAGDPLSFLLGNIILFDFNGKLLDHSEGCHIKAAKYVSSNTEFLTVWQTIFLKLMNLLTIGKLDVKLDE